MSKNAKTIARRATASGGLFACGEGAMQLCPCGQPARRRRKTCGDRQCLSRVRAHPPALASKAKFRLHEADVWSGDRWVSRKQRALYEAMEGA